ncbi:MAG: hypothetical protein KJ798_04545 [Gammaproteobacteria bacterium]|nr:hypothetical protein [Gammaproteobacteria bacterium]MBU1269013.1 hypothetical protein [Gammaproteobacteria bacterium]MBU1779635.1 hypothetical protein [Gammaproteobacteria bacterium]MBU2088535.1 hypothetical protein [Gammaproteobacteria bacterium]MBU2128501.1 hypothetical protein [Gammaproteobacteria bacterium]
MDSKIHKRLVTFVTQMQEGPLGRIPLDRVIKANLELFLTMRESGATWAQIANGLTSAGARRSDGRFISADHLRSAVSRQLRQGLELTSNNEDSSSNQNRVELTPPTSVSKSRQPSQSSPQANTKNGQAEGESTGSKNDDTASIQKKLDRIRKFRNL